MRDIIALACLECKRRNYATTKNKKKTTERIELSKFCRFCRKHTAHKESKGAVDRCRPVAQLAEHRSPKPGVGGSIPSWPATRESEKDAWLQRRGHSTTSTER